jgi:hypothetical protein
VTCQHRWEKKAEKNCSDAAAFVEKPLGPFEIVRIELRIYFRARSTNGCPP